MTIIQLFVGSSALAFSTHAHPPRHTLVSDVCVALDVDFIVDEVHNNGKPHNFGHLDVCLCTSGLPAFVKTDAVAQAAVEVVGPSKVEALIKAIIEAVPGQECYYPIHSRPSCESSNPCTFHCTDGFLPSPSENPSKCICPPHLTECDGKCGHFPLDCSPKAPVSHTRRKATSCHEGLELCGIPGGSNGKGWKCINTQTDAQTCGGCIAPSPFGGPSTHGTNCTNIPHVINATCSHGKCLITACESDFLVSPLHDSCTPIFDISTKDTPNTSDSHLGNDILENLSARLEIPHDAPVASIDTLGNDAVMGSNKPSIRAYASISTVTKIPRTSDIETPSGNAARHFDSLNSGAVSGAGANISPALAAMEVAEEAEKKGRDIDATK
ncbi:hypothetical protein BJ138DRAFT_1077239 [Hygrophoropsis aurantiaca]|uniref:Uncharacterized protein n=1 Tax=Hygrophoropsis aurantiaca TaxID=72124 RepID=A0ACB8AQY7_9AGAM|nr:hypothetical protein BJ138DRAFT_1077239 [Hygrophoropsis aurantiaca]